MKSLSLKEKRDLLANVRAKQSMLQNELQDTKLALNPNLNLTNRRMAIQKPTLLKPTHVRSAVTVSALKQMELDKKLKANTLTNSRYKCSIDINYTHRVGARPSKIGRAHV